MHSVYRNRIAAFRELKHRGYKISKTKFYDDCSIGLCKMEPDGTILDISLNEYVNNPIAKIKYLDQIEEEKKFKIQRVNRLLTPQEVAEILNCDKKMVIELCREGALKALHVRTLLRVLSSSVQRYINRQLTKYSYSQLDSSYIIACLKNDFGLERHEITSEMIHLKRQAIKMSCELEKLRHSPK